METETSHIRQEVRNTLEPAFEQIVDQVVEQRRQADDYTEDEFEEVEEELVQAGDELTAEAVGQALAALDPAAEEIVYEGDVYYRCMEKEKTYRGQRGPKRIERGLYRQKGVHNGPTICPLELRAGTVEGNWTPRCAAKIAQVVQEIPASRAVEISELPYSRSSLQRVSVELGDRFRQEADQIEPAVSQHVEVPQQAASVSVAVDRVSALMREGGELNWRMLWCGAVSLHDESGDVLQTLRYGAVPDQLDARLREPMRRDVEAILDQCPDLERIALGDGGKDVCAFLDEEFPDWPRRIDFWHLCQKVGTALRTFCDNWSTTRSADEVMDRWKLKLLNDDQAIDQIEEAIRNWTSFRLDDEVQEDAEAALTYIDNHRDQMRYASVRQKGLPVGSGQIEATCKSLVALRMKRNGQRWSYEGAQSILELRSLALSDRWGPGMEALMETYRGSVRPAPQAA